MLCTCFQLGSVVCLFLEISTAGAEAVLASPHLSCLIDTWRHCMQSFCCYQSQAIVLQPGEYPQLSHMHDMGMHSISNTVTQISDLLLQGDPQHAWRRCLRQSAAALHTFQADWLQPHVKHVRRSGSSKHRTKLSESYN